MHTFTGELRGTRDEGRGTWDEGRGTWDTEVPEVSRSVPESKYVENFLFLQVFVLPCAVGTKYW